MRTLPTEAAEQRCGESLRVITSPPATGKRNWSRHAVIVPATGAPVLPGQASATGHAPAHQTSTTRSGPEPVLVNKASALPAALDVRRTAAVESGHAAPHAVSAVDIVIHRVTRCCRRRPARRTPHRHRLAPHPVHRARPRGRRRLDAGCLRNRPGRGSGDGRGRRRKRDGGHGRRQHGDRLSHTAPTVRTGTPTRGLAVARDPTSRIRDIAVACHITERTAQAVIAL